MAEGGFDDIEMRDRSERQAYREYYDSRLRDEYAELNRKRDILTDNFQGVDMSGGVRIEYDNINGRMKLIEAERFRRREEADETETSFTDNDDGKTVTITRGGTSVEAPGIDIPPTPGGRDVAAFKRARTTDKKTFLRSVLGSEIRAGDGPRSRELLRRTNVNPEDGSAEFDDVRIFVKARGGGNQARLTTDKKMQPKVEEFEGLLEEAENERGLPTVDLTNAPRGRINGLTWIENRELVGVLSPSASTIRRSRIGNDGALQIQAEHLQESIDATNDMIGEGSDVGSLREFELLERVTGLEEARDRTLEQREREEIRELQEDDITRLERLKAWFKKNWLGASALGIIVASLLTAIIIGARTAAVKGAGAVKSFAKAVRDAIKKLGPWAIPIANFLYTVLKGGAAVLSWLASNLWVLVIALTWFIYYQYKERSALGSVGNTPRSKRHT